MTNQSPTQMSISISGGKIPMITLATLFATLISSIVYATIWLTKLDDRVINNYASTAKNQKIIEQIVDNLNKMEITINKNIVIQQEIIKDLKKIQSNNQ